MKKTDILKDKKVDVPRIIDDAMKSDFDGLEVVLLADKKKRK